MPTQCLGMALRTRYALCGTELAYGGLHQLRDVRHCPSVSAYARPTRSAVLSSRMAVPSCYALSGTELAYAATRIQLESRWDSDAEWQFLPLVVLDPRP
eukprot:1202756-Rhodomonas_salina.1